MYENMIQLYQKITQLKVLSLFLENPHSSYYLRESARMLDMDPMTVRRALNLLVKDDFLIKTEEKNRILYRADVENPALRHAKISYNLSWLRKKNTVDFILKQMKSVSSIDVDILTISLSKSKPTAELAMLLGRDANLVNFTPAQWSNQAKNNKAFYLDVITDGVLLYGTKPVV